MPSFPAAVKTFTTKNTGDVVQAAHVNDIQDEVNAIEAGYINGTARLNSSNLNAVGNSSFTLRPTMPPPETALVFLDAALVMGSSNDSTIAWLAESFVTNSSMHSSGLTPERLSPQSTGLFQATAQVSLTTNSSGARRLVIIDSTGSAVADVRLGPSSEAMRIQVTGYKRFDVLGSYVACRFAPTDQSAITVSSGIGASWFSLVKL